MTTTDVGAEATIVVGRETFTAGGGRPFVFGRADAGSIVGLDAEDMGISAEAGSIELDLGLWWIVNRSSKRRLLLETEPGREHLRLSCGSRHAVATTPTVVLVPGAIFTHRIEVHVPAAGLARYHPVDRLAGGTITPADVVLSEKDTAVLTALAAGYLRAFPRRDPRPSTYSEVAAMLARDWTPTKARRHVDRIKEHLAHKELYFQGERANVQLCEFVLEHELVRVEHLARLESGGWHINASDGAKRQAARTSAEGA